MTTPTSTFPAAARRAGAIAGLCAHVDRAGRTSAARRAVTAWAAAQPALAAYATAGEIAAAARRAGPDGDPILAALLAERDELADLTVVAGLARGLGRLAADWPETAGRAEVEAELVAACWAAVHTVGYAVYYFGPPGYPLGAHLLRTARQAVRAERRRQWRRAGRHVPLDIDPPDTAPEAGANSWPLELAVAVRTGRLSTAAAAPVFLTRVAGLDVADAAARLGCSAAALRARRSKAERRLLAAG